MAVALSQIRDRYTTLNNRFNTRWGSWFKLSYLFLQQVDLVLTIYAMSIGAMELNPLLRIVLGSLPLVLVFKVAIPVAMVYFIPGALLIPGILIQGAVIAWNIHQLLAFFLK
jgi:hypothetical protein